MEDQLTLSIGIGLAVSVLFSETFGIAAGGIIVPGYLALYLGQPYSLALTALASLITFWIVHSFSLFMIIYGRRRTVLMILVGYAVGGVLTHLSPAPADGETLEVIGYIIPGLIAIWLDRQGVVETFSAAATAAILVKLILILITGLGLMA
jgi:poly-gamma-glutamate biosynthesis protein PgsC/CapC